MNLHYSAMDLKFIVVLIAVLVFVLIATVSALAYLAYYLPTKRGLAYSDIVAKGVFDAFRNDTGTGVSLTIISEGKKVATLIRHPRVELQVFDAELLLSVPILGALKYDEPLTPKAFGEFRGALAAKYDTRKLRILLPLPPPKRCQ